MRVLVACEYSGTVRDMFENMGWDAWSCDILPTESAQTYWSGKHYQGNVLDILDWGWDLLIGFPPCTYSCNSGVKHLYIEAGRWRKMHQGVKFFNELLDSGIKGICLENPTPHNYAYNRMSARYSQIIQPWQFGHGETKKTHLWLKGLPPLIYTKIVEGRDDKIHKMPPGPERSKQRSLTYSGIARAMAKQWGKQNMQPGWRKG